MSQQWREDLTSSTLEEIIRLESENRARKKELKIQTGSLVNDKLAKRIGSEEYAAGRKTTGEESAECSRRARILNEEIATRRQLLRASKARSQAESRAPGGIVRIRGASEASLHVQAFPFDSQRDPGDSALRLRQRESTAQHDDSGPPRNT